MPRSSSDQELLAKMEAFAEWLLIPDEMYEQLDEQGNLLEKPNRTEIAETLGVTRKTTYEWEKMLAWPGIKKRVALRLMDELEPDFLQALMSGVRAGDHHMHNTYWRFARPILKAERLAAEFMATGSNAGSMTREELIKEFSYIPEEYRAGIIAIWEGTGKLLPAPDEIEPVRYDVRPHKEAASPSRRSNKTISSEVGGDKLNRPRLSDIGK